MVTRSWDLSEKQKLFLVDAGIKPEDYRVVGATASDYKFYNIKTKKILSIRR